MGKKQKKMKKTGKEIISLYKELKKAGIKPEEVMLYLLGHMQTIKATKIGMDVMGEKGTSFCVTVSIQQGTTDDQEDILPKGKNKFPHGVPPGVA